MAEEPKSPPSTTTAQRSVSKTISSVGIASIAKVIDILKPYELSKTQRLKTYQSMLLDDAVKSGIEIRTALIEASQANGYFKYDRNNETAVEVAKYLNYNMANMTQQTPRSVGRDASEFIVNGFAPLEFIGKKGKGKYQDRWVLDHLSYIDPLTLDQNRPIVVDNGGSKILHLRQLASAFQGNVAKFDSFNTNGVAEIPWKKVMYCSYSSSSSHPIGVSALDACYNAWREKILLQDYTLIGVTKDFAGTPVLYLPQELLNEAAEDPNSLAFQTVENLKASMANMHTGDQNYVILPSRTQSETGTGSREYEIKFLGVEGGGKGFDCAALVEQRKKAIFTALGASNLITGENGGGSYNLLEGQSNIQAHYAKRDAAVVDEMWNKQIFPMLLALNNMEVDTEDMPVWCSGAVQPLSHKEFTTGMQKLGAAALLPVRDPNFVNEVLERAELNYRIDATDPNWLDKMSEETSRSGDGMKEGLNDGVGKSTTKGADRSTNNVNNS